MGNENKSNKISLAQLVLLGLGSLIGSGWLFGRGKLHLSQDQQQLFHG